MLTGLFTDCDMTGFHLCRVNRETQPCWGGGGGLINYTNCSFLKNIGLFYYALVGISPCYNTIIQGQNIKFLCFPLTD